jgi:RNA-directed DNA polymerase
MRAAPKPKDKLDAMMMTAPPPASPETGGNVMVNGPEDEITDWPQIDWRQVDDDVRRLRQRIFTASAAGDLAKVRDLQKLMLRSRANALSGVRRVTEPNEGRATAGIDGRTAMLDSQKADLADWVQRRSEPWKPRPVKRVFIPKPGGRRRPLGIPVIADRALQAVVLNALEPEWEARFEPRSYGFRPGRGCHDAIEAIYHTVVGRNPHRRWILDADLAAAFDRIGHDHLLSMLGSFPARGRIEQWLTAGVVDQGRLTPTGQGTPPRRGDQPSVDERCLTRFGVGRRSPVHPRGLQGRWEVRAGNPGRGPLRRRPGRLVHRRGPGPSGQRAVGRVA